MSEVVFTRLIGWIPKVVREDGELRFELYAGADGLHSPRTFSFPIAERHLHVIRDDLARHLLLWIAILPLCDAAGTRGPLDEDAAVASLDPILLGPVTEVDAYFRNRALNTAMLVAHVQTSGCSSADRSSTRSTLRPRSPTRIGSGRT